MLSLLLLASLIWTLEFGGQKIKAEVALTIEEKRTGLADRDFLADGEGMLFIYNKEQILSFWMKGMKIPISIAFFDEKKRLINFMQMPLPLKGSALIYYTSIRPAKYALELPFDWFEKHSVQTSERFKIVN